MRLATSVHGWLVACAMVGLLACSLTACNGSGGGEDGVGGAAGQGGSDGQGGSTGDGATAGSGGATGSAPPLPTRITVDTSENRPGIDRTITVTYDLAPNGLPDAADLHIERDDGTSEDLTLTFVRDGAVEPCAAPPSVLAQEHVDALFFHGIGGCPSAVNAGGLVTEYSYGADGHVTSATTDWGAYGTGVLDVVSADGEVANVRHEYAWGVTSLSYQPGGASSISGAFDPDGPTGATSLEGYAELDALQRRERVVETTATGVTTTIEFTY